MKQRLVFVLNSIIFFPFGALMMLALMMCAVLSVPGTIIWVICNKNPGTILAEKAINGIGERLLKIAKNSIWEYF